ncbi:hypothetical protein [Spiroplasma clarkii]|uniref:hypothetical protein n=1 Tax=Spiroplasma clarkii TaxID=2139 RepID=UPI0011BA8745|nr:hypothetical protein [Spiroplasma clarkii]
MAKIFDFAKFVTSKKVAVEDSDISVKAKTESIQMYQLMSSIMLFVTWIEREMFKKINAPQTFKRNEHQEVNTPITIMAQTRLIELTPCNFNCFKNSVAFQLLINIER